MKRGADGDGGRAPKRGRQADLGPYAFKVLFPEAFVAQVMSKGATGVHEIEESTSTRLQFSPRGDYYPDTHLRLCNISSAEEHHIQEAMEMMCDQIFSIVEDERSSDAREFIDSKTGNPTFRCALSKAAAGAVIGTKGERINALRESSGARVEIDKKEFDNHQLVKISGSRDQVSTVLKELNGIVQVDCERPWFEEWAQQRGFHDEAPRGKGGSKGDDRAPRRRQRENENGPPGGKGSIDHRGCTVFVGRLAQATDNDSLRSFFGQFGEVVSSDVRIDPTTGRSKGFGFISFAEHGMLEAVFDQHGRHEIDGRWVDVRRYDEDKAEAGEHDRVSRSPSPPRGRERGTNNPRGRDDHRGGAGRDRDRDRDDRRGAAPVTMGIEELADVANGVPRNYKELDYCITCQLPSARIGALIGRRGENIQDVERKTGATVQINNKETKTADGPDAYRTVSIRGPMFSVYGAHMLLMRLYNDADAQADGARPQDPQVEDLQRQIAELSKQVKQVQDGKGVGRSGSGGGKGGKSSRRR